MSFKEVFNIYVKACLADAAFGLGIVVVGGILFFAYRILVRYFTHKKGDQ